MLTIKFYNWSNFFKIHWNFYQIVIPRNKKYTDFPAYFSKLGYFCQIVASANFVWSPFADMCWFPAWTLTMKHHLSLEEAREKLCQQAGWAQTCKHCKMSSKIIWDFLIVVQDHHSRAIWCPRLPEPFKLYYLLCCWMIILLMKTLPPPSGPAPAIKDAYRSARENPLRIYRDYSQ